MFVANVWLAASKRIVTRAFRTLTDAWSWVDDLLTGCADGDSGWVDEF